MRPTFDRRLWILLTLITLIQCISKTNQQNIKPQNSKSHQHKTIRSIQGKQTTTINEGDNDVSESLLVESFLRSTADDVKHAPAFIKQSSSAPKNNEKLCAKNCVDSKSFQAVPFSPTYTIHNVDSSPAISKAKQLRPANAGISYTITTPSYMSVSLIQNFDYESKPSSKDTQAKSKISYAALNSRRIPLEDYEDEDNERANEKQGNKALSVKRKLLKKGGEHQKLHMAHRFGHKELKQLASNEKRKHFSSSSRRARRETDEDTTTLDDSNEQHIIERHAEDDSIQNSKKSLSILPPSNLSVNSSNGGLKIWIPKQKRSHSTVTVPEEVLKKHKEPIIIIDDVEEFDSGLNTGLHSITASDDKSEDYSHDDPLEPRVLELRPVPPNPYDSEEMSVVYAEQHSEIRLMCEVDLDIASSVWYKNGQVVHAMDRTSRVTDYRFIKEANGALTISNVMLEDDGKWQCEADNSRHYTENARPVKLVVLDRPKPPYLQIDSRRLDAGNIFVPVQENSELNLACLSEGGNPKPTLTWEVLLSPGVDRHAQKVSAEVLELEEVKNDKDKNAYKINSGAKSEARLPVVYRAHHNARILCVMEHPTLKIRQNASLLLDVQYTPSFAISRTPGFGYPLREGIEVSLKCDVDSNPPSTPRWQKDDGDTPVPQTGDGFLNFTSIRREHSGWYKCTSRHLNLQYSSIGYYLSVRYDSVDVTSEPDDQDISVAAASHNPNKQGQLEVQLGGAVTLQCPQGSLGCWSHLDPVTARLRGLGHGLSTPTGQVSLKDVVYQDAGTYKCIGQSPTNKKKLEVLQTVGVSVKGAPTVMARNATPVAYPGSPLHLTVEFCANPPAHAARWLHGDRVFTPGNQYGSTVLAYAVTDLPTPYCKEARLTYVSMHERVPRIFYFIVSTPGGVAEATFKVNFTMRYRTLSNAIDDEEEELSEPEEIHFPVFGSSGVERKAATVAATMGSIALLRVLVAWCLK